MNFRTPRLYRYLEKYFVDDFFESGNIRLSSFQRFREHKDETRLDVNEGFAKFIHRTTDQSGETLMIDYECSPHVYTLCASAIPSKTLMKKFKADSAIVIWDPVNFAKSITDILNTKFNVINCIQGPCSYQFRRVVERDLGYLGIADKLTDDPKEMDMQKVSYVIDNLINHDAYFLKRELYANEVEYRFVWFFDNISQSHIDISVPNAVKYCARWENQGNWIAIDNKEST